MQEFFTPEIHSELLVGVCESDEVEFLESNEIRGELSIVDSLHKSIHLPTDFKAFWAIRRAVNLKKPDIVHTHMSKAGLLGRLASISVRPRPLIVHTYHGHVFDGYFGKAKTKAVITIERLLAHYSARLLAIGTKTKFDLVDRQIGDANQVVVIPTGMLPLEGKSRKDVRKDLGISQDKFVIIFAGRLTRIKRIDRLVEVIRLSAHKENLTWIVAGGGDEMRLIEQVIEEDCADIRFLGWRSDLDDIFCASDLSILLSDNEGTPLSVIQAGFHGVPTLATLVGSVGDLITDNLNGFLVERNPYAIATRISWLIDHPEVVEKAGRASRNLFTDSFSGRTSAEHHAKIYRDIINERQADES
jgi:glycosyltransferase involved in cell wall biosynthesis